MEMFLYLDKDTYMHRLDPRTKIFIMLGSFVIAMLCYTLPALLTVGLIVVLYGASGKTLVNLKRIFYILVTIIIFSMVIWSPTAGGVNKIWGPFTWDGMLYGLAMGVKIDVMIIAGMIFLSSTKIEEIAIGLVKLGLPYRAAFAFSTALRLVPMIVANSYTIIQAQKSRGLDLDTGSIVARAKKYVPLLVPVFISLIRGTNVFAMALESKGFGYSDVRSSYLEVGFKKSDLICLGIMLMALAVAVYLKLNFVL
ncbi:energy-coupling factor transporter transmembrane component T family protein [Zhaonella formicivorans]|jgi:energy-coupling factor transport system permease protein|uniref:energy-coupling factor transporter transmembrane component T family protein n=1 Tax=Zhaonella formicivorans TaxID=2528593 RepID=UPI0010F0E9C5|nr:energy-coupling factor transporter transmembrane component T [Zhaonella formicivorans]